MVGLWGMSEEVGPVYLGTGEEHVFLGREIVQEKAFSDATATRLDAAVRDIIEAAQERAMGLIVAKREQLHALVTALLDKETLDAAEVMAILGPRPVDPTRPLLEPTNGAGEPEEIPVASPAPAAASD
jgi:cell division protease FtsH